MGDAAGSEGNSMHYQYAGVLQTIAKDPIRLATLWALRQDCVST